MYWMIYIFKFFKYLPKLLKKNISSGSPFILLIFLPPSVPESQRGSQPFNWSYNIIPWSQRDNFPIFQLTKIQINVQGNILLVTLSLPVFLHISTPTISHVYQCEFIFPKHLPSGATMINI